MSRSIRRTPIIGFGKSEKNYKIQFHRKLRRKVNDSLQASPEADVLPEPKEVTNTGRWRKDPRGWDAETCKLVPKLLRK